LLSLAYHVYHPFSFPALNLRFSSCEQRTRKSCKPFGLLKRNLRLYSAGSASIRCLCLGNIESWRRRRRGSRRVAKPRARLSTVRTDGVDLRQTKSDSRQALLIDPTSGVPWHRVTVVSSEISFRYERCGKQNVVKVEKTSITSFSFCALKRKGLRASLCWQLYLRRV
jgi:hypothetical protein